MFKSRKKRTKRPKPAPILPLEYTGHHWPEREDDKDPITLPESWLAMIDSSVGAGESDDAQQ